MQIFFKLKKEKGNMEPAPNKVGYFQDVKPLKIKIVNYYRGSIKLLQNTVSFINYYCNRLT